MPRNPHPAGIAKQLNVRNLVLTAMLSALASMLMYLDFPLPLLVPWLKLDASLVPAMFAGLTMGPIPAMIVVLIKNIVHLFVSSSFFVGELADFIIGSTLVLTSSLVYQRFHTNKGLWAGAALGVVIMTIVGMLSNIYIMWPMYTSAMGVDKMLGMAQEGTPWVTSLGTYVAWSVLPFNLVKGILISGLTILLAKPLAPIIGMRRAQDRRKPA